MKKILFLLLLCFVLIGCRDNETTATPVAELAATETATEVPTATPAPTETPTLAPTATDTATPTDTPTPTATATATATATPTATATELPATPTATLVPTSSTPLATATRAAAPPPASSGGASPPAGPNLLSNPGFEAGPTNWQMRGAAASGYGSTIFTYTSSDYPNFVHSGSSVAIIYGPNQVYYQKVSNLVVGQTYRAGAWVKIWSSTGEDRTVSENPGDYVAQICINTAGDDDPSLATTICSGYVRPLDTWQYIGINAVATSDQVAVILRAFFVGSNRPRHNEALWDDVALGLAGAAATPTPGPTPQPVRPAPIAFNAVGLRDNMLALRTNLQNLGGLLDRLAHGQGGTCQEFWDFYAGLIRITTYNGIPSEWQGIYNDYLYAADHGIATNAPVDDLCKNGGGTLTEINYSIARIGVNESIDRLSPAIDAANVLLGQ